mmetsp:Transcript_3972/g.5958  ORF Transcript_3972/g.5958 Transcript_3972/m.5958 type:complete len:116 (+) Transcript_3972:144-491(+)
MFDFTFLYSDTLIYTSTCVCTFNQYFRHLEFLTPPSLFQQKTNLFETKENINQTKCPMDCYSNPLLVYHDFSSVPFHILHLPLVIPSDNKDTYYDSATTSMHMIHEIHVNKMAIV